MAQNLEVLALGPGMGVLDRKSILMLMLDRERLLGELIPLRSGAGASNGDRYGMNFFLRILELRHMFSVCPRTKPTLSETV